MPYKIIVTDPSPTLQRIVRSAFAEPEFRIFPFDNGSDLITSVQGIRPDALILSLALDGRDGYDVARALRRQSETRRTPLFFLKGAFDILDAGRIAGIEHDGILTKPFDSEKLVEDVRRAIEKRTTPTSLPEEPVWTEGGDGPVPEGVPRETPSVPERPGTDRDSAEGSAGDRSQSKGLRSAQARVKEWVRAEIWELERELEKRIRTRLLAELKDVRPSGGDPEER